MPVTIDDVRRVLASSARRDIDLVEGMTRQDLLRPTRCSGWDIDALVRHIIWGMRLQASALRKDPHPPSPGGDDDAEPRALASRIAHAAAELDAELTLISDLDQLVSMPYGDIPASHLLDIVTMELGIHGDDLASAAGRPDAPLDDSVIHATNVVLAAYLPVAAVASGEHPEEGTCVELRGTTTLLRFSFCNGGWVNDGEGPPTGGLVADDDSILLRFALGRVDAGAQGLTVVGDGTAATRFKSWFPGP